MILVDDNGLFENACKFLLGKRGKLDELWYMCHEALLKTIEQWYPISSAKRPNEIYYLSSILMENSKGEEWEVVFEARNDQFWSFQAFK